jgi:hypothetical protein
MPLVKKILETQILLALQEQFTTAQSPQEAQVGLAKALASAIYSYIKSATIIVPPGQNVTGVNAPGQALVAGPYPGTTISPGSVSGVTSAPAPPATIS